jgi:hypothetical protein
VKDQTTAEPCPLCDGTKVDPGGLPSCRACSVVSASLSPDNAAMVSSLVEERDKLKAALENMNGLFNTAHSRLALKGQWTQLHDDACASARKALEPR